MKLLATPLFALSLLAQAPPAEDPARQAIRATALDYIEGWYDGDAARMARALHPELAKRVVKPTADGKGRFEHMGTEQLLAFTKAAYGKQTPKERQQKDVQILDVFGSAATVKVTATDWIDYLHVARIDGRWVIVNVLWELKPRRER